MHERHTVQIPTADGEQIEAWYYRPAGKEPAPAIVMGHGMGAVKAGGLQPFAERFSDEGFAVVAIDYRQWGGSSGRPRDVLNVLRQRQDYSAAIEWAAAQSDIDEQRLFVFGTSFSGMHATALAASDHRLAGVIVQSPLVDGIGGSRLIRLTRSLPLFGVAILDRALALFTRRPIYLTINVAPGEWGVMDTSDALYGKELITPREPAEWKNRLAARSLLSIAAHRPIRQAADIAVPILIIVPEQDTQAPTELSLKVAARAAGSELHRSKGGHYDVYQGGAAFDDVIEWEVEFLRRHAGF